jgi:hypothetical protein
MDEGYPRIAFIVSVIVLRISFQTQVFWIDLYILPCGGFDV